MYIFAAIYTGWVLYITARLYFYGDDFPDSFIAHLSAVTGGQQHSSGKVFNNFFAIELGTIVAYEYYV